MTIMPKLAVAIQFKREPNKCSAFSFSVRSKFYQKIFKKDLTKNKKYVIFGTVK